MSEIVLGSIYGILNQNAFGGTPYHFATALKKMGSLDACSNFDENRLSVKLRRATWNLTQLLRYGSAGGFQYSDQSLRAAWSNLQPIGTDSVVISLFQLLPRNIDESKVRRVFYVDQTLHDLFHYYNVGKLVTERIVQSALEREREQLRKADWVVYRSNWAARRALELYDLDMDKVSVVLPGANLDLSDISVAPQETMQTTTLKLVFVGKEWKRKGLDRLLDALLLLDAKSIEITLDVIGADDPEIRKKYERLKNVNWHGFVDKSRETQRFVDIVSKCDLGCLLSRAEAGGISLREFGRLGVPAMVPQTGGSPEFHLPDSSILLNVEASTQEIASTLYDLSQDNEKKRTMKRSAEVNKEKYDWSVAAAQFSEILSGLAPARDS